MRQAREQNSHASDIAIVFACLIGAAIDDILNRFPIDIGVAFLKRLERNSSQVISTHR